MNDTFKSKQMTILFLSFGRPIKTNIDCFLFGAQLKS